MPQSRHPAGTPVGGRFASAKHAAGEVSLLEHDRPSTEVGPYGGPPRRARIADYFQPGVSDYVATPWVRDGRHITLVPEDWAAMPTVRVSPSGLHATQSRLIKEHLTRHLSAGAQATGGDVPWLVRYRGQDWVIDGHHRMAAAQLRGDDDVEVHLLDLDAR